MDDFIVFPAIWDLGLRFCHLGQCFRHLGLQRLGRGSLGHGSLGRDSFGRGSLGRGCLGSVGRSLLCHGSLESCHLG